MSTFLQVFGNVTAYSSAGLAGLVGVVEAGLAVAAVPRCSVPPSLRILQEAEDLPAIQGLGMKVLHSPDATSTSVEKLQNFIKQALLHES